MLYVNVNVLFDLYVNSDLVSITIISWMTKLAIPFLIKIAFLRLIKVYSSRTIAYELRKILRSSRYGFLSMHKTNPKYE